MTQRRKALAAKPDDLSDLNSTVQGVLCPPHGCHGILVCAYLLGAYTQIHRNQYKFKNKYKAKHSSSRWLMPTIPALRKLKEEDHEFETRLWSKFRVACAT